MFEGELDDATEFRRRDSSSPQDRSNSLSDSERNYSGRKLLEVLVLIIP